MPLVLTLHRARDPADRQRESRTLDDGSLSIGRGPGNGWVLQDPAQHLSKTHCIVSASAPRSHPDGLQQQRRVPQRRQAADAARQPGAHRRRRRVHAGRLPDPGARGRRRCPAGPSRPAPPPHPAARPGPSTATTRSAWTTSWPPRPRRPAAAPPGRRRRRSTRSPTPDGRADDPFGDDSGDMLGCAARRRPPVRRPAAAAADRARPRPVRRRRGQGDRAGATARPPTTRSARTTTCSAARARRGSGRAVAAGQRGCRPRRPSRRPSSRRCPTWTTGTTCWATPRRRPSAGARRRRRPRHRPPRRHPPHPSAVPPAPAPLRIGPAGGRTRRRAAARRRSSTAPGCRSWTFQRRTRTPTSGRSGELFGTMVESLRDVLMSRAVVKGEFGVEQTMLRSRDNNALKFSVTPADAVAALLQPGRPGYMDPMRATKEAFDDVRVAPAGGDGRGAGGAVQPAAQPSTRRRWRPGCRRARVIESMLPGDAPGQAVGGVLRRLQGDRARRGQRLPGRLRPRVRPGLHRAGPAAEHEP